MQKTAVLPGVFPGPDREGVAPQPCYAVATVREGYRTVVSSGEPALGDDVSNGDVGDSPTSGTCSPNSAKATTCR